MPQRDDDTQDSGLPDVTPEGVGPPESVLVQSEDISDVLDEFGNVKE